MSSDYRFSGYSNEDYTVAWITALHIELTAAVQALDVHHGKPRSQNTHLDRNTYELGKIGLHMVVIACLPAGMIGNNPAATLTSTMRFTFPSLRFALLVGIGGGIPGKNNDVRLGDVVVSQPSGYFGGVVQFDHGKEVSDGGFIRLGQLNSPPTELLTALNSVKSKEEREGSSVPRTYEAMLAKFPEETRRGYTHPGPENDRLFKEEYQHYPLDAPDCDECNHSMIKERKTRLVPTKPVVHYGVIASGNVVVKDSTRRQRLHRLFNALCVEMEAAGLMSSFDCLVIRGICDYADSHKNDDWHKYAALVAGAYAKVFLSEVTPINTGHLLQPVHGVPEGASRRHANNISPHRNPSPRSPYSDFNCGEEEASDSGFDEHESSHRRRHSKPPSKKEETSRTAINQKGSTFPPPKGDTTTVHAWINVDQTEQPGRLLLSRFVEGKKMTCISELRQSTDGRREFQVIEMKKKIRNATTKPFSKPYQDSPLQNLLVDNSSAQIELSGDGNVLIKDTVVLLSPSLLTADKKTPYQGIWSARIFESTTVGSKPQFFLFHQPDEKRLDIYSITGGECNPRGKLYGYADLKGGLYKKDKRVIAHIMDPDDDDEELDEDLLFCDSEGAEVSIDGVPFHRVDVYAQMG